MMRPRERDVLIERIIAQLPPKSVRDPQAVLEAMSMEGLRNLYTNLRLLADRRGTEDPRGDDCSAQRVAPLRAE